MKLYGLFASLFGVAAGALSASNYPVWVALILAVVSGVCGALADSEN